MHAARQLTMTRACRARLLISALIRWTCHVYSQHRARRNASLSQSLDHRTLRAKLRTFLQFWRYMTARRNLYARAAYMCKFRKRRMCMQHAVERWRVLRHTRRRNRALVCLHVANIQRKLLHEILRAWHVAIHKAHKDRHLAHTCMARRCRASVSEALRTWRSISKKANKTMRALETYRTKWYRIHSHRIVHCWGHSCTVSRRNRRLVLHKLAAKSIMLARKMLVAWRLKCGSLRGGGRASGKCVQRYMQRARLRDVVHSWLHVCKQACRHAYVCQQLLACKQRVRMRRSLQHWRTSSQQTRIHDRTTSILFFRRQHGHHTCVSDTLYVWSAAVKRRARALHVINCLTKQKERACMRAALRMWQAISSSSLPASASGVGVGGSALWGSHARHRQQVLACVRLLRRAVSGWSLTIRSRRGTRMGELRLCLAARRRHFAAWKQVLKQAVQMI